MVTVNYSRFDLGLRIVFFLFYNNFNYIFSSTNYIRHVMSIVQLFWTRCFGINEDG